ncbi:carboxymuconolactone decarboxylase family protein [Pseudonocardia sp. DSM 110487]|uniref:carboxymuconolactone decarboxylase family protein n=1 Tax=Pseudonocardia sp. DSM 110487 TaxID=2865833 RepID=UPI002106EAD6|nr:carboxymuconolactone decarboxylase family protein [Pseudonocardia sp. DSM 110487]
MTVDPSRGPRGVELEPPTGSTSHAGGKRGCLENKDNGATEDELIETITHLAFYAGWPKAMSAMAVAKRIFRSGGDH